MSLLFGNGGAQKNNAAQNWTPFFPSASRNCHVEKALCIRILALLLSSRTSIARRTHTNNKKKNESDQVGRRERTEKKKAVARVLVLTKHWGPHIVGLKSYLIGKQFKINKPARGECELAL